MGKKIQLVPHFTVADLERRYRQASEATERSRWQIVWLLSQGQTAREVASSTGYSPYWIGQIARRYNVEGAVGLVNRQHTSSRRAPMLLSSTQLEDLRQALAGPPPTGERWTSHTVADWMAERLGRPVPKQRGWDYLQRLGAKLRHPRPRHVTASAEEQQTFKKKVRTLSRAVATAFPEAQVELWVTDEHRIGLKPIRRRVWTLPGQRPVAPVEPR